MAQTSTAQCAVTYYSTLWWRRGEKRAANGAGARCLSRLVILDTGDLLIHPCIPPPLQRTRHVLALLSAPAPELLHVLDGAMLPAVPLCAAVDAW